MNVEIDLALVYRDVIEDGGDGAAVVALYNPLFRRLPTPGAGLGIEWLERLARPVLDVNWID